MREGTVASAGLSLAASTASSSSTQAPVLVLMPWIQCVKVKETQEASQRRGRCQMCLTQSLCQWIPSDSCTRGPVAMTSASHAEARQFELLERYRVWVSHIEKSSLFFRSSAFLREKCSSWHVFHGFRKTIRFRKKSESHRQPIGWTD